MGVLTVMIATHAARSTGRLGERGRFARRPVEDKAFACRWSGNGGGERLEEFCVGLWWCDGCFHVIIFLLDQLDPVR